MMRLPQGGVQMLTGMVGRTPCPTGQNWARRMQAPADVRARAWGW
ncbi:hypothetical protein HMPREF1316_2304 [Olsenella profusa F0195]|uniref:Uncharacterized protein n=1 Tax=Olsenella profusa F0195 TaxID=1125712 RepID=U2TM22_9ACTN|nr:hypothetical protein HMPREF1316_2304 [Olsenella profusa F0195]